MLRILCAAAVISLVLGILTEGLAEGWMEGASILIAVVIIVAVTAGNNYVKEQQFQKLCHRHRQGHTRLPRGRPHQDVSL